MERVWVPLKNNIYARVHSQDFFNMAQSRTLVRTVILTCPFQWRITILVRNCLGLHHQSCSTIHRNPFGFYRLVKDLAEFCYPQCSSNHREQCRQQTEILLSFAWILQISTSKTEVCLPRPQKSLSLAPFTLDERPRYDQFVLSHVSKSICKLLTVGLTRDDTKVYLQTRPKCLDCQDFCLLESCADHVPPFWRPAMRRVVVKAEPVSHFNFGHFQELYIFDPLFWWCSYKKMLHRARPNIFVHGQELRNISFTGLLLAPLEMWGYQHCPIRPENSCTSIKEKDKQFAKLSALMVAEISCSFHLSVGIQKRRTKPWERKIEDGLSDMVKWLKRESSFILREQQYQQKVEDVPIFKPWKVTAPWRGKTSSK